MSIPSVDVRLSAPKIQFESLENNPTIWAGLSRVDEICPPHDHDHMEIAVVLGGRGRHLSPQGEQPLRAGDVIILRPGTWHSFHDCHQLDVFNCSFKTQLLHRELSGLMIYPSLHYLFWAGPLAVNRQGLVALHLEKDELAPCLPPLEHLAKASYHDFRVASVVERVGYLTLFLAQLARALEDTPASFPGLSSRLHPSVQEGMRLLESDIAHPWTLKELAECLYVNHCHLARLFTASLGLAPMAYLARCRAERSAEFLLRTTKSSSEIAKEVGWPDPNYFARRFKAHFNMTPTQYREQFVYLSNYHSSAGGTSTPSKS